MHILQLSKYYPPTHGGLEVVAEFFSRSFFDNGHNTTILSVGKNEEMYFGKFGEKVLQTSETFKLGSTPVSFGYLRKLREILKKGQTRFIFVHLPNPMAHEAIRLNLNIIREMNIRVIGVYHSDIINQVLLRDAYNLYFKDTLSFYDQFICSSPHLRDSSSILSILPRSKVTIIPFCIHPPPVSLANSEGQEDKFNFVAIGRMVPYKGYDFLVDAFKDLPWKLTIIGNGPSGKNLKKMASNNVYFAGDVSEGEKFEILTNSNALIVSSINRSEAYGMTIVEAFSLGLPVIASDIDTGVSFLVKDGERGYRFRIKDKEDFKFKIHKFTSSKENRSQMGLNCLSFYQNNLTYDIFNQNVFKFLSSFNIR